MTFGSRIYSYALDIALQPDSLNQLTKKEIKTLIIAIFIVIVALVIGTLSIIKRVKKDEHIGQGDA